jgi:sugar phosphate isomerase/epimerase
MHRLSVNEVTSFRWSFFQDVVKYSALGVQTIGLWRSKVDEFGFEQAADLLSEMRLAVSSLSWAGGFTGSDGNSYRLALDDAIQALFQAHMVGADKLIIYPGGRNGHTHSHALRLLNNALEELLPVANDLGVQILLEQVTAPKSEANFLCDPQLCFDFLQNHCPQGVGLVVDLFHLGCNRNLIENFFRVADRVKLVQLSDRRIVNGEAVRCRLGSGEVPFDVWFDLLQEYEYSGQFEIKLHGYDFEHTDYSALIQRSREFYSYSFRHVSARTPN